MGFYFWGSHCFYEAQCPLGGLVLPYETQCSLGGSLFFRRLIVLYGTYCPSCIE